MFAASERRPMKSKVSGQWVPDVLLRLLDLSAIGLRKRGLGEERYLAPLSWRVEAGLSPAEAARVSRATCHRRTYTREDLNVHRP